MHHPVINIFIADDLHKSGIALLKSNDFSVSIKKGMNNSDLLNYLKLKAKTESVLIFRSVRTIDKNFIDEIFFYTGIKILCTASTGFDHIDVKYAKGRNIKVFTVPDGNYISAAEHTFAMLLAIMKNIINADNEMKRGIYDYKKFSNIELMNKTIGIIGVGKVGSTVAKFAKAFKMHILGNDIKQTLKNKYPWISFLPLNELIKNSDIITVHTPLDDSTKILLNNKNLMLMKNNSVLLNCARGGIIEEKTLIRLLKSKKIYYAGIDVFENEPDINKDFLSLKNVILTPHLAGKTIESKERISFNLAKQIIDYYKNKRVVNTNLLN